MTRPDGTSDPEDWLIGGREARAVVIVDADPTWPARFAQLRDQILAALPQAVRVEHIGSTSVPGLAAKPVIDVVVDVADVESHAVQAALERAGFALRVREPGHRMFRTPARDVHVHLWSDPAEIERHLTFRDWLRHDADDRARYEAVKRELATREWGDTNDYAAAKGPVIAAITERADAWAKARR